MEQEDMLTIEKIKAKYKAPDYRPLEFGNKRDKKIVEIVILVLCALGLMAVFEGHYGEEGLLTDDYDEDGDVSSLCTTYIILFLIILWYFKEKMSKERDDYLVFCALHRAEDGALETEPEDQNWLSAKEEIQMTFQDFPGISQPLSLLGAGGFLVALGLAYLDVNIAMPLCWGSIALLIIPFFALINNTKDTQEIKKRVSDERERALDHEELWEKVREHEEHNQFDAAMRIWSKLGEEGEVERVTRLKTECLCVVLKRKIKDLTEMGADCTQLEEQLAVIETALAESASSKSSIGTESEE